METAQPSGPVFTEAERRLLQERALKFAHPEAPTESKKQTEALVFRAGAEEYAIALTHVAEVLPAPAIVPVPRSAPELEGLVVLRGRITPLLNLPLLLGNPFAPGDGWRFAILLRGSGPPWALGANELVDIRAIDSSRAATAHLDTRFAQRFAPGEAWLLSMEALSAHDLVKGILSS